MAKRKKPESEKFIENVSVDISPRGKAGNVNAKKSDATPKQKRNQIGYHKAKKKTTDDRVKIVPSKGASNAVMKYRKLRAAGKIGKVESLEELSKWFTKKGTVKKRETRYNKGREQFNKAVEKMRKDVGGKNPSQKRITDRAKFEKGQKTYTDKFAKDKRFTKQAREKANQYAKMVEVFASETFKQLREGEYGLGSEIVEMLAEQGLSDDDIIDFLNTVKTTLDRIPNEAKQYTERDDFWNTIGELADKMSTNPEEISDVVNAYITVDGNREHFAQAYENYLKSGKTDKMYFSTAWELLNEIQDPASTDNLDEILERYGV